MKKPNTDKIMELRKSGMSYGQIALALGISVNTIKSHCRRNRTESKDTLDNHIEQTKGLCRNC